MIHEISAIAVALLMGLAIFHYCILTFKGKKQPTLATWILFVLATNIAFITNLFSAHTAILKTLIGNAANVADVPTTWAVLITILVVNKKNGWKNKFNGFDLSCIIATLVVLIIWAITQKHLATNLVVQIILTIGYFPTLKNLWRAKGNPESLWVWIAILAASVLGLYLAIESGELTAKIYSWRAVILVSVLLILIIRANLRAKN